MSGTDIDNMGEDTSPPPPAIGGCGGCFIGFFGFFAVIFVVSALLGLFR